MKGTATIDPVAVQFEGSQAGYDLAIIYAGNNGIVGLYPGTTVSLGTIPAGVTVLRATSTGWTVAGTGIITGRFGDASTATTGGAVRWVDGATFPLTVTGVNAALNECEAVGGGTVIVPANGAISVTDTSVKIPNRCTLKGWGNGGSSGTFLAAATANVSAMVENKTQDGTAHYCHIENISCNGNKGAGAIVSAGIYLKGVFVTSYVRDTLVYSCSGNGIKIDGGLTDLLSNLLVENVWVVSCSDDNILVTGAVSSLTLLHVTSESPAAAKAAIRCQLGIGTSVAGEHRFTGIFMEGNNASDGLVLDQCANILADNIVYDGGSFLNVVKITGSGTGSDGAFGASGHTFRNVRGNLTTIIDDQSAGVTVGNAQSRFIAYYSSPSAAGGAIKHQVIGLQHQQQGVDVASTAAMTIGNGNLFTITGTASITSIPTAARDKGRIVTLLFSGTAATTGVVDGSNLKINGDFVYTPDATLTLVSNGTNWYEKSRSSN